MDLRTCYEQLGGSYDDVLSRIPSERLVDKFLRKFLADESFAGLCSAMAAGSRSEAFLMAHTLKGVCANLGFARLFRSTAALTELLRPEADAISADAAEALDPVREDYALTVDVIRAYIGEEG
ncbi:MAG: Hpt domain-containing protein [Clostridiales bacterium]|nr:Hpt domain-containing protein [Clostridiales bacterium]